MSTPEQDYYRKIVIGVTTYMRPTGLLRLLESLDQIELPDDNAAIEIVIVDNDASMSAESVVREARKWLGIPLRYEVEPRRGIAHARNAVVSHSSGCDLLVFVDDDECVTARWLVEMLNAQRQFGADVVVGPVIPVFAEDAPCWVVDGQSYLYHFPRFRTGTRLSYGHTGNVLFTRKILERGETSLFDERFGLTGSEDTFLFMQLVESGAAIYWCDEALAYETVPPQRTSLSWILKRAYSGANSFAVAERLTNPGLRTQVVRIAKGTARIGTGVIGMPLTILFGRSHFARMATTISKGVGMVMGTVGRTYEMYREVPSG